MLGLIVKLGWNGYADTYNGKAFTSKIVRALRALYAHCDGRIDEMEEALLNRCKGTEFFVENIMNLSQAQVFDYLKEIVEYEMSNPFTKAKKVTKKSVKAM